MACMSAGLCLPESGAGRSCTYCQELCLGLGYSGQGAGKRPLRHGEGHVALSLSLSQPGCAPTGCWGSVSASLCFFSSDPGKGKWSWVQFSPNLLHQAPALLTAPFRLRFMS